MKHLEIKQLLPIVLIHNGNSGYLYDTLFQLRVSNPTTDIYLIGTSESSLYSPLINHVDVSPHMAAANYFKKRYKHFSTNSAEFELICLQRWFVLKSFMESANFHQCLYIDSDVLVFSDVSVLAQRLGSCEMTICGISGHTNFVKSLILNDFCQFLLDSYKDGDAVEQLRKEYQQFRVNNAAGGISDMTFLYKFYKAHPDRILDISSFGSAEAFDVTIDTDSGEYEMLGRYKKITWINNKPYCTRIVDKTLVLHHTLHFQGNTKGRMTYFIREKTIGYVIKRGFYASVLIFQKLKKKFSRA